MQVTVTDLDNWDVEGELDTGLQPFTVAGVTISPSLTCHADVLVTGRDWLPIRGGEVALLIHSPDDYFDKPYLVRSGTEQVLRRTPQGAEANLGTVRELPGESILVGGVANHYHWLVDYLPRLLMARRCMRLPRLLINPPSVIQAQSLDLLGIRDWEIVHPSESVRCERLWIPSLLARQTVVHPEVPAMLRQAFPASKAARRRSLYLSRRDAASRRIVNEPALLAALPDFELHAAGDLSFQQQVDLFASCERLLAAHGAGMANVVFCPPGARVFEIYTPLHQVTSMKILSILSGAMHDFVPARNVTFGADGRPLLGDWEVDIEAAVAVIGQRKSRQL